MHTPSWKWNMRNLSGLFLLMALAAAVGLPLPSVAAGQSSVGLLSFTLNKREAALADLGELIHLNTSKSLKVEEIALETNIPSYGVAFSPSR